MCGRYVVFNIPKHAEQFGIDPNTLSDFINNYNASPGQNLPVITLGERYNLSLMKWGLIPRWAKDPSIGYKLINARSETVHEKPSYKKSFETTRCLVPANGFYEWQQIDEEKVPFYFRAKDEKPLIFAGLYSFWMDIEGKRFDTFTILTKRTVGDAVKVHHRTPVLLKKEDVPTWLNYEEPINELSKLFENNESETLEFYKVTSEVGNPRNNYPELIEKV